MRPLLHKVWKPIKAVSSLLPLTITTFTCKQSSLILVVTLGGDILGLPPTPTNLGNAIALAFLPLHSLEYAKYKYFIYTWCMFLLLGH